MFTQSILREKIEIEPVSLCREWKTRFFESLRRQKERTIAPGKGAILSIVKLLKVESPVVQNSKLFCTIEFEALNFVPANGSVFKAEITMVIPLGLVIEAEGLIRVLIQPANMPNGYKFDSARKVFSNGIHSFGNHDVVRFLILNTQYKADKINCIGSLKDVQQVEKVDVHESTKEMEEDVLEPPDTFDD